MRLHVTGVLLMAAMLQNSLPMVAAEALPTTYREAKAFLGRYTDVVELCDDAGACVLICPKWQARVMTSTCDGPDGMSFGFIHREFIEAGKPDLHFSNYGAEDRLWLSPEGGRFSLWFAPGARQTLDNWYTPPTFNEGAYDVVASDKSHCRMTRQMQLRNTAGTQFDLLVNREVRLLGKAELAGTLGETTNAKTVAYETINTITNQGPPMTKEKGFVSMWILSMLNAGPETVVVVPYRSGNEQELGPVVRSDYFGAIPSDRLKITAEAILLKADAKYRSKIGTSQKRVKNTLGAIDFQRNVLTLARFTMPDDPAKVDYMNNLWGLDQPDPYTGDVANAYNDGPPAPGQKGLGTFCEIESLSPAVPLRTDQSLSHRHCTIHIQADPAALARISQRVLGVDLNMVRQEMELHR